MWLYSGLYRLRKQCPVPSPKEQLKTALGVYSLARQYDLADLEQAAAAEISLLKAQVDIIAFIDVIDAAYPRTIGEDLWMVEFLAQYTKESLTSAAIASSLPTCDTDNENIPVAGLIVKGLLVACGEAMRELATRETALLEKRRLLDARKASPGGDNPVAGGELGGDVPPAGVLDDCIPTASEFASTEAGMSATDNHDSITPLSQIHSQLDAEPASTKKTKKFKNGKPSKKKNKAQPQPEAQPALQPETPLEAEHEILPTANPESEKLTPISTPCPESQTGQADAGSNSASQALAELAGTGKNEKKDKKKDKTKKAKMATQEAEPEPESDQDPVPEPELGLEPGMKPAPEVEVQPDGNLFEVTDELVTPAKVKKSKKKKTKSAPEQQPGQEIALGFVAEKGAALEPNYSKDLQWW